MNKIKNIQSLRGVAVLLVVLFHLFIVENKYSHFDTLLPNILQFGNFGVDLFFVISGFVMVTVTRGKFQDAKQSLMFLYNRLTRIYPLYWVYSLLALVVFLVRPSWVNSSQGNQVNILASFLLLPSDKLPLVQVGWTLIHEIYFYLVYFFIFLIVSDDFLIYAVIVWGICVTFFNLYLHAGNPFLDLVLNPLTLEFLGGCLLAIQYYKTKNDGLRSDTLLIVAGVSLLVAVFGYDYYRISTGIVAPSGWWRVLLYGLPALCITYSLIHAERRGYVLPLTLSWVGNASYSIYLSHLFTINVIGRLWSIFSVDYLYDNVIFILITLILVLLVGFLSYWLVENKLLTTSHNIINRLNK